MQPKGDYKQEENQLSYMGERRQDKGGRFKMKGGKV